MHWLWQCIMNKELRIIQSYACDFLNQEKIKRQEGKKGETHGKRQGGRGENSLEQLLDKWNVQ